MSAMPKLRRCFYDRMVLAMILSLWFGTHGVRAAEPAEGRRRELTYAPAPVDNPLKGLVPYAGDMHGRFPHSMEFGYIPLSALMTDFERFEWRPLEDLLNGAAGRGHQAIFRVFLEYAGKRNVIPGFLIQGGLKVHRYAQSREAKEIETPDYGDANLRRALRQFIAALGRKYDGDPRIGFITAGLLGTWGEWHTYPRNELFASPQVQAEVLDAYEAAFKVTPVLLRYPAGETAGRLAFNATRRFGYHDDSFAWGTLETGKRGDDWFYMAALRGAGREAMDKWKTQPIGGEIRPEAWGKVFDPEPGDARIQDFGKCVEATHATWLMDSGMFGKQRNEGRIKRAEAQVRRMGYEFHVAAVTVGWGDGALNVKVELENRGVAPFHYDWPVEYGLLDGEGKAVRVWRGEGKLTGLLPGEGPRMWNEKLAMDVAARDFKLALRVPNPLDKGNPVRFANREQDAAADGWLTLGDVPR
jgi:hypothetical protein